MPRAAALELILLLALAGAAHAQRDEAEDDEAAQQKVAKKVLTHGEVCPDPKSPCLEMGRFQDNELSFRLKSKFDFDRGRDRSLPFYAAILKSGELCKLSDDERVAIQAQFPTRKVFLHRFFCQDFTDKVTYTNVNRKAGFIAVYAGKTEADAKQFLAEIKAAGKFPDANLRRMQVEIVNQLE
jgi:hypothetical protein